MPVIRLIPLHDDPLAEFTKLTVHRFRVFLAKNRREALLVGPSDTPPDDGPFKAFTDPVVHVLPTAAELRLEYLGGWFRGDVAWHDMTIDVTVWCGPGKDAPSIKALALLDALWQELDDQDRAALARIIKDMLEWFNQEWRSDDETEHTVEQFNERLSITGIFITGTDYVFTLDYCPYEMFGDHRLSVHGSLKDGFSEVEMGASHRPEQSATGAVQWVREGRNAARARAGSEECGGDEGGVGVRGWGRAATLYLHETLTKSTKPTRSYKRGYKSSPTGVSEPQAVHARKVSCELL